MAIYVNGVKVAGRGISGKSPYQVAVGEGYTGTEAEFNAQLAAIGEAVAGFEELSNQVDNAKAEIEAAVEQAREDINVIVDEAQDAVQAAQDAVQKALEDIEKAKTDVNDTVTAAKAEIEQAKQDALDAIPNAENLATIAYVDSEIAAATAAIVTDIWQYSDDPPKNGKLFWIDTNTTTGGLKFLQDQTADPSDASNWVHVPVAWQ